MHPHQQLLTRLFERLNAHDHQGMVECYSEEAVFRDIAFELSGRDQIGAMWEMICAENEHGPSTITATVEELSADEKEGLSVVVETYTIRDSKKVPRPVVRNVITSRFCSQDGKILRQVDDCDAAAWGRQAFGGLPGFVMGHFGLVRRARSRR